jgi:hypothetical protein
MVAFELRFYYLSEMSKDKCSLYRLQVNKEDLKQFLSSVLKRPLTTFGPKKT